MTIINRVIGDTTYSFAVTVEQDTDHGAPWEECDGHGPVSEWVTRDKFPGELVLNTDRNSKRYYDFAAACKQALAEGWDCTANKPTGPETPRQRAARAARADYDMLKGWCDNKWCYNGIIVTLLDQDGETTEVSNSLWGVDNLDPNYPSEVASDLVGELAQGHGTTWGKVTKETYGNLSA